MKIVKAEPAELAAFMQREWTPENIRRFGHYDAGMWIKTPGALAAYDDTELVGAATYYTRGGVGHLSELIVAAHKRGQGVGSALLEQFQAQARATGCHKLTLVTYWDPQAVDFYRKHGFAVEAVLFRDVYETDMCQMAKFIDKEGS